MRWSNSLILFEFVLIIKNGKIMKSKFLYPVILFVGFILVNMSVNQAYGQTPPVKQQVVKYTCPMHPEVVQDKPGKCPKCGMTLVEKKEMKKSGMKKDSTMMKHDHNKMKHDSTSMKKGDMKM